MSTHSLSSLAKFYYYIHDLCSRTTWEASTRRVNHYRFYWSKRWWGGSDISWIICKSFAPRSRQITTPVPHHSDFTGRMSFLLPNQQHQSTTIQQNFAHNLIQNLSTIRYIQKFLPTSLPLHIGYKMQPKLKQQLNWCKTWNCSFTKKKIKSCIYYVLCFALCYRQLADKTSPPQQSPMIDWAGFNDPLNTL